MRLDPKMRAVIQEETARHFGPNAKVRLFGSRVRDDLRGGDIDLYIEAEGDPVILLHREMSLFGALQARLGEQRVGIVVDRKDAPLRPIDIVAKREGIPLTVMAGCPPEMMQGARPPLTPARSQRERVSCRVSPRDFHAMTPEIERLLATLALVEKQAHSLRDVTQRLFAGDGRWDGRRLRKHLATPHGIDQVEAFGAKFGRLQDTLVDKLFPRYLEALGERKGPAIDTLNRLEALGFIDDSASWLAMRRLRNRLVHEYVEEDLDALAAALNAARAAVDHLLEAVDRLKTDIHTRWPGNTA